MQDDEDSSQGSSNPHRPANVVLTMVTQDAKNYVKCLRYSDREEDAVEALNALLEHHGHLVWASKELARIRAIRRCATQARAPSAALSHPTASSNPSALTSAYIRGVGTGRRRRVMRRSTSGISKWRWCTMPRPSSSTRSGMP